MLLSQLISSIDLPLAGADVEITGLTADSRQVQPGGMFVAIAGVNVDGHQFIPKAVASGAAAVVCQQRPADADAMGDVRWIEVPDSAMAMGLLCDAWWGHPSSQLTLVGVTGTNGKTTIATLLYDMARLGGQKAGLISTVANKIDGQVQPATHTTPDVYTINSLLRQMVDAGCTFCAMEVSSHACDQKRIAGLRYRGGIFTNLTRDHLDYHKTFARYLAAKKSFFDSLGPDAFALANADDKNGMVMLQNTRAVRYTYSIQRNADFRCRVVEDRLDGMILDFQGVEVVTAFTGRYNASNLTAVYGAWLLLGHDKEETLRRMSLLTPVEGRMQTIHIPDGPTAIVDYAHTPDALANTLAAIAESLGSGGRIITVAGAGGDRDAGKRPLMAAEAVKRSSLLVITSDNPRSEDPAEIAAQMLAGVADEDRERVVTILDRRQAIAYAIGSALPGDAVLIAGKGHEKYQIIGGETHHFDDVEEVRKLINEDKA